MISRETTYDFPTSTKLNVKWERDMFDDFYHEQSDDARRRILTENGVPNELILVAKELFSE